MQHIKFLALFLVFLLGQMQENYAMQKLQKVSTRYIVNMIGDEKSNFRLKEQPMRNFNNIVDQINAAIASDEGKLSDNAQYLTIRLSVMKAISQHINKCFIEYLNATGRKVGSADVLEDLDIEKKYKRNVAIPSVSVSSELEKLVTQFIPCDLLTDKKYFAIIGQTRRSVSSLGNLFNVAQHYIRDEKETLFIQLNSYLAWVDKLIILTLLPMPVFKKVQDVGRHLLSIYPILEKIGTSARAVTLQSLRDNYIKNTFTGMLDQLYDELLKQFEDLQKRPVVTSQETLVILADYISILIQVMEINTMLSVNNNELKESINNDLPENLVTLQNDIAAFLKKIYGVQDERIKSIKDLLSQNPDDIHKQFSAIFNTLKMNKNITRAFQEINRLKPQLRRYINLLEVTNVDTKPFDNLLKAVEQYEQSLPVDTYMLYSLQLNLEVLRALAA